MSAKGAFGQGRNRSRSGKRSQQKAKAYKKKKPFKKIEIEATTDKKLDETNKAVHQIFASLDTDGNGQLDLPEFRQALEQMDIMLPVPIMNFIFDQIDKDHSRTISFDEFIDFCNNDEELVRFSAEYTAEFSSDKFGLELVIYSIEGEKRIVVTEIDVAARNHVLPGSEVLRVNGQDVRQMNLDELEKLIKESQEDIRNHKKTCTITFEKKSEIKQNLGLLMGDEDWLVLSRDVSRKKMLAQTDAEQHVEEETKHCRHCPPEGTIFHVIHHTVEDEKYNAISRGIIYIVMAMIFLSTLVYVLSTIPSLRNNQILTGIEIFVSIVFTIEYIARIMSCANAWVYFWDALNLVDFLAVIPFWIELTIEGGGGSDMLRVIRVIRLARIFRLLKSARFREWLDILLKTFKESSQSGGLLVTLMLLQIIIFASLLYYTEMGVQDKLTGEYVSRRDGVPSKFTSILSAAWWCIVTMTTVGYGDMYPKSPWGMAIAILAMFIGLFVIALPVIIVGGKFEDAYEDFRIRKHRRERRERSERNKEDNRGAGQCNLVEDYLQKINAKINVCGVSNVELPFFTEDDMSQFVDEGFDTEEKVKGLLKLGKHAIFFLPRTVPQYKLFVLYEIFGKDLRDDYDEEDMFSKIRRVLISKIQSC